jgi:hypothetical protein
MDTFRSGEFFVEIRHRGAIALRRRNATILVLNSNDSRLDQAADICAALQDQWEHGKEEGRASKVREIQDVLGLAPGSDVEDIKRRVERIEYAARED